MAKKDKKLKETRKRGLEGLALTLWVGFVLFAMMFVGSIALALFVRWGWLREAALVSPVTQLVYSAIIFVLSFLIIYIVPSKLFGEKSTRDELGLRGLPTWTDILLAIVFFIAFMLLSSLIMGALMAIFPSANWEQAQELGFSFLGTQSDLLMAFISLVVVAPIAEELIFRGWLYGKLRARMSFWPAMLLVSILFGVAHRQLNVGVVVGVMSAAMCLLRELTGTIYGGILVHMLKNGIAFFILYSFR